LILAGVEPAPPAGPDQEGVTQEKIVLINETWMWRLVDEKPTMLESPIGRWFHRLLAGWLVLKGISGVSGNQKNL
jgi:hypothetical protein